MKIKMLKKRYHWVVSRFFCNFRGVKLLLMKPKISIALPPVHAAFLRSIFTINPDNSLVLCRSCDTGYIIISNVLIFDKPVSVIPKDNEEIVELEMPTSAWIKDSQMWNVGFSSWGVHKIKDFIRAEFNQYVRELFAVGYQHNYSQKQIVEAILLYFNVKETTLTFEAVKKADYRNRKKELIKIISTIVL